MRPTICFQITGMRLPVFAEALCVGRLVKAGIGQHIFRRVGSEFEEDAAVTGEAVILLASVMQQAALADRIG